MNAVAISNLSKTYYLGDQSVEVLRGLSFEIVDNELVAITGPSGSGKSTLMNILGCLDTPTAGTYLLAGEDVSQLTADQRAHIRNRRIGFIFQSFNLLPRLDAVENVEVPLLYGTVSDSRHRAIEALTRVGLGDRLDHRPSQLSGGQCQRVAIARALVTRPAIILADEPTGNLDSRTTEEIMALLHQLHAEGVTIIIVTHEPEIAGQCGRVISLHDGRIRDDLTRSTI